MKIYDCFSYWDEDLLLDVRLNIMSKFVDYFVIVEGNKTWQNNSKKLRFDVNKFKKFKDNIIYVPVEDMPDGDNPYDRENFQRNCISRGIKDAEDIDLILISDLDEIPNPFLIKGFDIRKRYAVFEQKLYYYKFNLQSISQPFWYGSRHGECHDRILREKPCPAVSSKHCLDPYTAFMAKSRFKIHTGDGR